MASLSTWPTPGGACWLNPLSPTLTARRVGLAPLAESIIQQMVTEVLVEMGFTTGGQPVPPVLYHSSPLPWALIVSPRGEIRQDANIQLRVEYSLDERIALEEQVAAGLDVSTLVVPVGGIGVYPTMVLETWYLPRLVEVVAHEWIHNYLTLRPLGMRYGKTPALRQTLAEATGVPLETILEYTQLSDLTRVGALKRVRARLYYDAGVDTIDALAAWDPAALREMFVEYVTRTGFDGIAPLPKEIRNAVATAKTLPRLVEYEET